MKKNNFYLIDNNYFELTINNKNQTICFLDLGFNKDLKIKINLKSNNNLKILLLSFNKDIKQKTITLNCDIQNNNNQIKIINNFFLNHANLFFKFKANDHPKTKNNQINLKVDSIIEDENSCFQTCPIYDFFTNTIDAKHALNIGIINNNYLDYLLSRGILLSEAKMLFYQSKINYFIKNINQPTIQDNVYQKIKSFWE